MAVYVNSAIAAAIDDSESPTPSHVFAWGKAAFTGRLIGLIPSFNFTFCSERAEYPTEGTLLAPGLVFENDDRFADDLPNQLNNLGSIVLAPYSVIMPGSAYTAYQIMNAAY